MAVKLSSAAANACLVGGLAAQFNSGYLRIYAGSRPATPDDALVGVTLLAELRFGATAFAAPSDGAMSANAITSASDAASDGTASFYRTFASDGTTALTDGDISAGGGGGDMTMGSTSIVQHQEVTCSAFVHVISK
jgi:hypothetical protein